MRKTGVLVPLLVLPFLAGPAASAPTYPRSIPLPDDFQPEGITSVGSTFYVGSLRDGDIYRGDLRSGEGALWVDTSGRAAVGILADPAHGYLWVAGGPDGTGRVYDADSGALVGDLQLAAPGPTLVNDVTVTGDAAYFTDTFAPRIYKVPVGPDGSLDTPETITVTGPAGTVTGGFGMNGIRAIPGGRLLVDHTDLGILATVDPATGASQALDLGDTPLTPGTLDGLIVQGRTVWVVENFANRLAEVRVAPDWQSGTLVSRTSGPLFRLPTTVTRHGQELALVNGRFDLGFPPPFGPGAPPGTDFDVVVIHQP